MTTKQRSLATLAALLATALGGAAAFAQGGQAQAPQSPAPQQVPMTGQGMMHGGGMMGQGGGMMGQMDMAQMNKAMENCNKMMERAMQAPPPGSAAPQGNRG